MKSGHLQEDLNGCLCLEFKAVFWDLFFYFFNFFNFIFKLYIIVLVLPNIKMSPPQVYMLVLLTVADSASTQ